MEANTLGMGPERSPASSLWPDGLRAAIDLPELDRAIIRALQADGRRPYASMARELGVAEKTIRRRVGDLRERGVIEITTVADPVLLGYGASALLGINVDGTRTPSQVAERLATLDAADHVVVTTGQFDVFAEILCRDDAHLLETVETSVLSTPGVGRCETFPYLRLHYQEPVWDSAQGKAADQRAAHGPGSLDAIDRAIIAGLSDDGRTPFQHIAADIGVSESQVRQRVNAMVDQRRLRIMAITNPASLGFRTIAWLGITAAPGAAVTAVAERLAGVPSIAYLSICAGRFDLFAEAVCVDAQDLLRLVDEEIRPMEEIHRVESSIFLKIHYKRLRPLA
jgi:DNA-binding Lrp family transcriptional regulator